MLTSKAWPSKDGFRVGFLNINHVINKLDEIATILYNSGRPFHLFCFAESRLDKNKILDSDISMENYTAIRLDPTLPKQTGLLLYINKSVSYRLIPSLDKHNVESVWVEVKIKHCKPITFGFIYRNPIERIEWIDRFNDMLEDVMQQDRETFILGDF